MAGLAVRVDVLGDTVLHRRFLRIGENASDLSTSFESILDTFEEWTGEQFESEGAEFGTPWEPLADSTIRQKARMGAADPAQPLVMTGALVGSLQGGPGGVRDVGPDQAEWGTHDENAMWHHGRRRSGGNSTPRRPIFELDEARRRWVMRVLHEGTFRA